MVEPQSNAKAPVRAGPAFEMLSRLSSQKILSAATRQVLASLRERPSAARVPFSQSDTASALKDRVGPAAVPIIPTSSFARAPGQSDPGAQSHYQLPASVPARIIVSDSSLAASLENRPLYSRRHTFRHGEKEVHLARSPSEAHAQWVLELFSSGAHPEVSDLFVSPAGLLVHAPPPAPQPSLFGLPTAAPAPTPEKTYLVSVYEHASAPL